MNRERKLLTLLPGSILLVLHAPAVAQATFDNTT